MQLPSLRNLQVFEVAARHQSFRAAADALFLTHGAVSRQVRALEAELGIALFVRTGRRVVLTPQGQRLQLAVAEGLKLIADSAGALRREAQTLQAPGRLSVTVLPSFAARWLQPRLAGFTARHPEIALDIIATMAPLDLATRNIALGIRNGLGKWSGLSAQRLAGETLFPVMTASGLANGGDLPQSPHALLACPLLNPYDEWERWFRRAGVIDTIARYVPADGHTYQDASLLLQAAEQGVGIALGRKWLVADALRVGTLVRLPGPAITSPRAYYVVYPESQPLSPQAQKFIVWLRETMRDD